MSNYAFDRKPYMPTTSSCLVGPRAESISMSCEQWFEVVGYMARPGRVSSFEAEIPKARIKVGYAVDNDDWLIDMVNVPTNKVKMNQKRLYGRPF